MTRPAAATNWTAGFYSHQRRRRARAPLVISNAAGVRESRKAKLLSPVDPLPGAQSNDTLDDNACPLAPDLSSYSTTWLAKFAANAIARLNAQAPGAHLHASDALNLMQLCGFETEYLGKMSPFCGLFTQDEFAAFEVRADRLALVSVALLDLARSGSTTTISTSFTGTATAPLSEQSKGETIFRASVAANTDVVGSQRRLRQRAPLAPHSRPPILSLRPHTDEPNPQPQLVDVPSLGRRGLRRLFARQPDGLDTCCDGVEERDEAGGGWSARGRAGGEVGHVAGCAIRGQARRRETRVRVGKIYPLLYRAVRVSRSRSKHADLTAPSFDSRTTSCRCRHSAPATTRRPVSAASRTSSRRKRMLEGTATETGNG